MDKFHIRFIIGVRRGRTVLCFLAALFLAMPAAGDRSVPDATRGSDRSSARSSDSIQAPVRSGSRSIEDRSRSTRRSPRERSDFSRGADPIGIHETFRARRSESLRERLGLNRSYSERYRQPSRSIGDVDRRRRDSDAGRESAGRILDSTRRTRDLGGRSYERNLDVDDSIRLRFLGRERGEENGGDDDRSIEDRTRRRREADERLSIDAPERRDSRSRAIDNVPRSRDGNSLVERRYPRQSPSLSDVERNDGMSKYVRDRLVTRERAIEDLDRERRDAIREISKSVHDARRGDDHSVPDRSRLSIPDVERERRDHDRDDRDHDGDRRRGDRDHHFDFDFDHRHVHGPHCGHHFYGGRWHDYPSYHRHYPGCGHYYYERRWHAWPSSHVHGPGCGHFYDRGVWLSFGGYHHQHHPGCGHYFYDGLWHNYSRHHRHYKGCGHYYYSGAWRVFPRDHVHGPDCGHYYDGVRWYVAGRDRHVHGPGCGHYRHHDFWSIYPSSYYRIDRPREFYFFVGLGDYERRGVPEYAAEYQVRHYADDADDVFESGDHAARAYAHFARGNYYRAIVRFDSSIERHPDDGLLYFARAQAKIAVGDYHAAHEDIVEGFERIPDWADVRINITEIYSDPMEYGEHLDDVELWTIEHTTDWRAHFVLGYLYFFTQEYALAKNEFVYTLAYAPDHPWAERMMDEILEREAEGEPDAGAISSQADY